MRSEVPPALAAARSSYRPAAKDHARIAELLSLHSCTDPPCSHRHRVALEGTSSPYAAMSTSGQGAVLDRMDTTSHPSPGSQGDEPPPPPGPRDEAGAADGGHHPGPRHGDHQSGSSSSSTSASTASIQGEEDPGAAGVLSGTPQQELEQAHPRPINQPEEVTNMQLSSRLDPQHTSNGSRGSPSQAAFPMSPAPGATPGTLTS